MIGNVIQRGSSLQILNESGQEIGWTQIASGSTMEGFSSEFIVVREGGFIMTLDSGGRQLGSVIVPEDYRIRGIAGSSFLLQAGSNLLERYSSLCSHLGSERI